jgi:putative methanogen marker protein 4
LRALDILERIQELQLNSHRIGFGIRIEDRTRPDKIKEVADKAESMHLGRVIYVGQVFSSPTRDAIYNEDPERTLLDLLFKGDIDAAVRGTAKASIILRLLKEKLGQRSFFRIALLETSIGHQFLLAPVGIDEGSSIDERLAIITSGSQLLKKLGVEPRIGILSGGRMEDIGRSPDVDKTIEEGQKLTSKAREQLPYGIEHYGILVEDAIQAKANLIVAPDGMTGNFIYRTLIHLGSGKSHGAIYVGIKEILVDTSRSAPPEEYLNAIRLANALASITKRT